MATGTDREHDQDKKGYATVSEKGMQLCPIGCVNGLNRRFLGNQKRPWFDYWKVKGNYTRFTKAI